MLGLKARMMGLFLTPSPSKARNMTPFRRRLTPATQRMAEDMLIRNMAVRTIDSYTYHVDRFAKHFGKLPDDLGPEEIRAFQLWLIQEKKCSWSSFNQAVCGLRFLYTYTLKRPWVVQIIPFGNRPKKLPVVLGQEEVHRWSVASLIKRYTPAFLAKHRPQIAAQVESTLTRIGFCRTAPLGGRTYQCQRCHAKVSQYNSCTDRHCQPAGLEDIHRKPQRA
jgi:hypothetical protein